MDPVDRETLEEFAARIRKVEPDARIWAFGSCALWRRPRRIRPRPCIVVPERTDALRGAIRDIAWEIGFARERVLTTVILSRYDFHDGPMSASTLVRNILREGLAA